MFQIEIKTTTAILSGKWKVYVCVIRNPIVNCTVKLLSYNFRFRCSADQLGIECIKAYRLRYSMNIKIDYKSFEVSITDNLKVIGFVIFILTLTCHGADV